MGYSYGLYILKIKFTEDLLMIRSLYKCKTITITRFIYTTVHKINSGKTLERLIRTINDTIKIRAFTRNNLESSPQ
jgi:hypothetical protein